jgi:pimeloyl-ACP methyl ester carboxylesterase
VSGPESGYVGVDGLNTYYEVLGDGTPLMLLHGGFGNAAAMMPMAGRLAATHRVYMPERRGHGHTADPGDITYELMAEDTAGFMREMDIGRAPIVGYSDGAIICFYLGMRHPKAVERLVPISGNFHWNGLTERMREVFARSTPEAFAMVLGDVVTYYNENSPDGPDHFPVVFSKMQRLFLNEPNLTAEDLGAIQAPTLVLAADRDLMTLEHTVELHRAIQGSQLCIIPGANHNLVFDRAEEVSAAVSRFLAQT